MARITIDLSPLIRLFGKGPHLEKAIIKHAMACEIAGADSVMIPLGKDGDTARQKTISILSESLDRGLLVKFEIDEKSTEALQELKPTMAVLRYEVEKKNVLPKSITGLQVAGTLAAVEIQPDIEIIKQVAKSKCDYIALDCDAYCSAKSLNSQLAELDKIIKLAELTKRLSMGIIAVGNFDLDKMAKLSNNSLIEEYIVGLPAFSLSLMNGYRKTIELFKKLALKS